MENLKLNLKREYGIKIEKIDKENRKREIDLFLNRNKCYFSAFNNF